MRLHLFEHAFSAHHAHSTHGTVVGYAIDVDALHAFRVLVDEDGNTVFVCLNPERAELVIHKGADVKRAELLVAAVFAAPKNVEGHDRNEEMEMIIPVPKVNIMLNY